MTAVLTILGIINLWKTNNFEESLPLVIFYAILTFNTFFSIRLFSDIIPLTDRFQWMVDAILAIIYIILAFNLDNPMKFALWAALLFSVSVVKYIELLYMVDAGDFFNLLRYKMVIDGLGTISCVGALGGIIFGFASASVWLWVTVFIIANIYIFTINPLYSLPKKSRYEVLNKCHIRNR